MSVAPRSCWYGISASRAMSWFLNYDSFYEGLGDEARALKRDILKLPKNARMEICNWLVGALKCRFILVDADYREFTRSPGVEEAHITYGETFYSKRT